MYGFNINRKYKIGILFILFFFITCSKIASCYIRINEIMYNPEGSDNNKEYIEIFFDNWTDLTHWIIADSNSNDTLELVRYSNSSYALIVEEGFDYKGINASIYSVGAAIGNNLNNDGKESIYLYDNNMTLIDNVSYSDDLGADGDGKSLQLIDGIWHACMPTPGSVNTCNESEKKNVSYEENTTEFTNNLSVSYLRILELPARVESDEIINIKINAYRGNTAKYAVYLWLEDDEQKRITNKLTFYLYEKFTNFTVRVPLIIREKCKIPIEEKIYFVVLTGLDTISKREIKIKRAKNEQYESKNLVTNYAKNRKIEYEVEFPEEVEVGKKFWSGILIKNMDEKEKEFYIWSYVYRGKKCYSCENGTRKSNMKHVKVAKNSEEWIELDNIINSAIEGNYTIKLSVLEDGRKLPKEFTSEVTVKNTRKIVESRTLYNQSYMPRMSGYTVYRAKNEIIKYKGFMLFSLVSLLIALYYIIKSRREIGIMVW